MSDFEPTPPSTTDRTRQRRRVGLALAAVTGAAALGGFGLAAANAADTTGSGGSTGSSTSGSAVAGAPDQHGGPGGSADTPVTGDALTKVKAAVAKHDAAFKITEVRQDPDKSYDVLGTSGGQQTMLQVSADLATITEGGGPGGHGGPGGPGGSADTPVTGDALTKVKAAVAKHDAAFKITEVRQDPDKSYDVLGTSGGQQAMLEVSADLGTITEGGPGGPADAAQSGTPAA